MRLCFAMSSRWLQIVDICMISHLRLTGSALISLQLDQRVFRSRSIVSHLSRYSPPKNRKVSALSPSLLLPLVLERMTRGSFCNCTLSSRNLSSHEPCDDCRPAKKRRTGTNDTRNNSWDPGTEDAVSCFVETAEEHMWDEGGLTNSLPVVKHQPPETSEFSVEDEKVGLVRKLYSSSLYTDAFDLTLDTVLAKESHLFSKTEAEILQKYRSLPYEARYLYTKRTPSVCCRLHYLCENNTIDTSIGLLDMFVSSYANLPLGFE